MPTSILQVAVTIFIALFVVGAGNVAYYFIILRPSNRNRALREQAPIERGADPELIAARQSLKGIEDAIEKVAGAQAFASHASISSLQSQQETIDALASAFSQLQSSQQAAADIATNALHQLPYAISSSAEQTRIASQDIAVATRDMVEALRPALAHIATRLDDLERRNADDAKRQLGAIQDVRSEAQGARQEDRDEARREGRKSLIFNIVLTIVSVLIGALLSYLLPLPR